MKYAITYNSHFRYFDNIDEVIFPFRGEGDLIKIVNDTLKREDQTAIIDISGNPLKKTIESFLAVINKLRKDSPYNIMLCINGVEQRDWIEIIKENEYNFMFKEYAATTSEVAAMALLGASDIYVAEDMCFNLKILQSFRRDKGIRFRIWPDIIQDPGGCVPPLPRVTSFYIRPEDLHLYFPFVDVIEIHKKDSRCSVVYEIYRQEQWSGDLSDLITEFPEEVSNTSFLPNFGLARLNCKKRCTYSECDICTTALSIGEATDLSFVAEKVNWKPHQPIIEKQAKEVLNKQKEK